MRFPTTGFGYPCSVAGSTVAVYELRDDFGRFDADDEYKIW